MSRLNPPTCLIDHPLTSKDHIDVKDLVKKSVEISIPGSDIVFLKKVPDFAENTALKKSVDWLFENVQNLYDTDGKELFVDELATHITSETVKTVSFIIHNEEKRLVFIPILHAEDVDAIIASHQKRIDQLQEELDTSTTSEARELLALITIGKLMIETLRDFLQ